MKTMAKYPGLMRRGSRWHLRVKVPADLVEEAVLEYGSEEEWAPAAQAQADELLSAAGLVLD
jgi:hypothetical protein